MLGLAALSACVAAGGMPTGAASARPGIQAVSVEGLGFQAEIAPAGPGMMLTADGARAVQGLGVRVRRSGVALAMDEGALAKRAARAGCRAAGGRFQEVAIGGYDRSGAWVFPGACA